MLARKHIQQLNNFGKELCLPFVVVERNKEKLGGKTFRVIDYRISNIPKKFVRERLAAGGTYL